MTDRRYFLSASNPLATIDQRDVDSQAIRIFASPALRTGIKAISHVWKTAYGENATVQDWEMFDAAMQEYAFN